MQFVVILLKTLMIKLYVLEDAGWLENIFSFYWARVGVII